MLEDRLRREDVIIQKVCHCHVLSKRPEYGSVLVGIIAARRPVFVVYVAFQDSDPNAEPAAEPACQDQPQHHAA